MRLEPSINGSELMVRDPGPPSLRTPTTTELGTGNKGGLMFSQSHGYSNATEHPLP
jgi:hypothetical protein